MTGKHLFWWGLTLSYVGLTYATLGDMPVYWRSINGALAGHGLLFQYAVYFVIGAAVLVPLNRKGFLSAPLNLAVTAGFIVVFAAMFYLERNPGEKIHMLQYGILGWLLHQSIGLHFDNLSPRLYCISGPVVLALGAADEAIQGLLPNRYFTLHDVFINGLSGVMVQLYVGYYLMRRNVVRKAES